MKGLPVELLFILFFGAIVLFNFLKQRAARRNPPEAAQDEPPPDDIPEELWGRAPLAPGAFAGPAATLAPLRRAATPAASAVRPRRRFARRTLLGARRDVQDAFVVATILGRCRADEPHEVR